MAFKDLREFVRALEEAGQIRRVEDASLDLEIGGATQIAAETAACPALLFDTIRGFPRGMRILTNALGNKVRERLVFGIDPDLTDNDAVRVWKERLEKFAPSAPRAVATGPIRENVLLGAQVDLEKIPWPKWHERDGGAYQCGAVTIARDPDTGKVQIAPFAAMRVDRQRVAPHVTGENGIWKTYWERGKPCPVAISLGHDPALSVAAEWPMTADAATYDFAGWLRGAALEVCPGAHTGLPIPATAEIVLEGEVEPPAADRPLPEGPFGSAVSACMEAKRQAPQLRIHAMLFRNDPIILASPPFRGRTYGVLTSGAAAVWRELDVLGIPNIAGVNHYGWGVTIVAVKQAYPGHVKRVAHALLGSAAAGGPRFIILVDDDIDPYLLDKVFWAIATRYDPAQAVDIVRRITAVLEGSAGGDTATAIIDACRPYHWIEKFPRTTDISDALLKKTAAKWGRVLSPRS